jgi:hypothetical protein
MLETLFWMGWIQLSSGGEEMEREWEKADERDEADNEPN